MERIDLFKFNASLRVNIVEKISDNLYAAKMYDYVVLISKSGEILSLYDYDNKYLWDMETTKFDSPYKYDFAFKFIDKRSLVVKDGKYGFIDENGKEITELKFYYAESFSEGLTFVNDGEYQYYIDIDGNLLFQTGDIRTEPFKNGVSIITDVDDQYGIMDKTGSVLIVDDTLQIKSFSEELAPSQSATNNKWGYINKAGKYEISPNYEDADPFSEGLAAIQLFGKWGYIDKSQILFMPHNLIMQVLLLMEKHS